MKNISRQRRGATNKRHNGKAGFTLAELLVSVGILAILLSIGMIAILQYQKSIKLNEMDGIAQEIFVAAQNHIASEKASGEWDKLGETGSAHEGNEDGYFGTSMTEKPSDWDEAVTDETDESAKSWTGNDYYYITYDPSDSTSLDDTILADMLPFGSLDDTVRSGGNYVIEYNYKTGAVYGVFYTDGEPIEYDTDILGSSDGLNVNDGRFNDDHNNDGKTGKDDRKSHKPIIGYYGGAMAKTLEPVELTAPTVRVINADTLKVEITDPNNKDGSSTRLTLTVQGEESKSKQTYDLTVTKSGTKFSLVGVGSDKKIPAWVDTNIEVDSDTNGPKYTLVLDDVTTSERNFNTQFCDAAKVTANGGEGDVLYPGENITITATVTSKTSLAVSKSNAKYTNSLFGAKHLDSKKGNDNAPTASVEVGYVRHLLNLSSDISNINTTETQSRTAVAATVISTVKQTRDINWTQGKEETEAEKGYKDWSKVLSIYSGDKAIVNATGTGEDIASSFYGISNSSITSYDGNDHILSNFVIDSSKYTDTGKKNLNVGLFADIGKAVNTHKMTIKNLSLEAFRVTSVNGSAGSLMGKVAGSAELTAENIRIIDPTVAASGSGDAGSLIGNIENTATTKITGSGAYFVDDETTSSQAVDDETNPNNENNQGETPASGESTSKLAGEKYEAGAYDISATNPVKDATQYRISSNTGNAGGLVGQGKGEITDSFASVPVYTNSGNVGGLLGAANGATEVSNSYSGGYTVEKQIKDIYGIIQASTDSSAEKAAGGLIGASAAKLTLKNCYTTNGVYGKNAGGLIGLDSNDGSKYTNCYTIAKVTSNETASTGKVGAFAGESTATRSKCYYVSSINSGLAGIPETDTFSGISYNKLKEADFDKDEEDFPLNDTETQIRDTHYYDAVRVGEKAAGESPKYPFALVNKTFAVSTGDDEAMGAHYGDWPSVDLDAQMAYYEIYNNDSAYTIGLYNEALSINTLSTDNDAKIIQDGYVILTDSAVGEYTTGSGSDISEATNTTYTLADFTVDGEASITISSDTDNRWSGTTLTADSTYTVAGTAYYLRFLNLAQVDAMSGDAYYSEITVTNGNDSDTFWYNPHYAKSAIYKGESLPSNTAPTTVSIRTERQYSMMTQDLQNPTTLNTAGNRSTSEMTDTFKVYYNLSYKQELNLNFGNSTNYTKYYFETAETGNCDRATYEGGIPALHPVVAASNITYYKEGTTEAPQDTVGFCGTYNGNYKTISNLTLTATGGYSAGMFGNTQGALIENLTLKNITVTGEDNVGAVVGSAAHTSKAASASKAAYTLIQNVNVTNPTITGNGVRVGGLVGASYSCTADTITLQDITVQGNSMLGGVYGYVDNYGSDVTQGYPNKNITVSTTQNGANIITETDAHTTKDSTVGTGGFAGMINVAQGDQKRILSFSNINIQDVTIVESANNDKSKYVYAGSFVGNYRRTKENNPINLKENTVNNVTFQLNGNAGYASMYNIGGIYGAVTGTASYTVTLPVSGMTVSNITVKDNATETEPKYTVGGSIGIANRNIAINNTINDSYMNQNTTSVKVANYGSAIGSLWNDRTLDVAGHTPSEVSSSNITAIYQGGLVGRAWSGSKITGVTGKVTASATGSTYVGGIVGYLQGSLVPENSSNTILAATENINKITVNGTKDGTTAVGGLVGRLSNGNVTDIQVETVSIAGNSNIGGIAGYVDDESGAGSINGVKINTVNITASGSSSAGALAGMVEDGSVADSIVKEAIITGAGSALGSAVGTLNGGSISGVQIQSVTANGVNATYLGGLVGYAMNSGSDSSSIVESSVNDAQIKGRATYMGGLVGQAVAANINNCDVHSDTLHGNDYSKNEQGVYVNKSGVESLIKINNEQANSHTGGLAGGLQACMTTQSFAAIPVQGVTGYVGGFVGDLEEGEITYSYASGYAQNTTDEQDESSYTGGFAAHVRGISQIDDCYATGDVRSGHTVGGFVGGLDSASKTYFNNCYSLGEVDKETTVHGGFAGKVAEANMTQEPVELKHTEVDKFYKLLKVNLLDQNAVKEVADSEAEKKYCESCLHALCAREGFRENPEKLLEKMGGTELSVYAYLKYKNMSSVDSTAASGMSETQLIEHLDYDSSPSVAAVVQLMLKISHFEDISGKIQTWRLSTETINDIKKLVFYYTAANIDDYKDEVKEGASYSVPGYKYYEDTDSSRYYRRLGTINLIWTQSTYGSYVTLGDFHPQGAAELLPEDIINEQFTGCTYLSDTNYNQCEDWSDSSLDGYISAMSFARFKGEDKIKNSETGEEETYLQRLNSDKGEIQPKEGENARFVQKAAYSYKYDAKLEEDDYSFPTLNRQIGSAYAVPNDSESKVAGYWGDWPVEEDAEEIAVVYYEKIQGDETVYYSGYSGTLTSDPDSSKQTKFKLESEKSGKDVTKDDSSPKTSDTLVSGGGKYVEEDNYLILVPDNIANDASNNILLQAGENNVLSLSSCAKEVDTNSDVAKAFAGYTVYELDWSKDINWNAVFGGFSGSVNTLRVGLAQNSNTFASSTKFKMTPYFGDTVRPNNEEKMTECAIRSARQLSNFSKKSNYTLWDINDNPIKTFKQGLDIDMTNAEYPTSVNLNNTREYISGTYEKDNLTYSYKIKGLENCMFASIQKGAAIKGITLTDLQITSTAETVAGLVLTNYGTIENCSIRPDKEEKDAYTKVKIASTHTDANVSGLVGSNDGGTISDCYVVGTISGTNVYGLTQKSQYNTAEIKNCYVNGILNGTKKAVGFVGTDDQSKIEHCNALVSMTCEDADGKITGTTAYGFLESRTKSGTMTNCYVAMDSVTAEKIYAFGSSINQWGENISQGVSECYYWEGTGMTATAQESLGEVKSYDDLKNLATGNFVANENTTHKFNSAINSDETDNVYPFALYQSEVTTDEYNTTMQFYGDWPKERTQAGLIYYEKINGKTYYHGYVTSVKDKTQEPIEIGKDSLLSGGGKYVSEDGYVVLLPKGAGDQYKLYLGAYLFNLTRIDSATILSKADANMYDVYRIGDIASKSNFYTNATSVVSIWKGTYNPNDNTNEIADFRMTPHFGDSVQPYEVSDATTPVEFKIRSARHLKNLQTQSAFAMNSAYSFIQELDISYDIADVPKFTDAGIETTEYKFQSPIATMYADYTSDKYKDDQGTTHTYKIKGLTVNLFGVIGASDTGTIVKGVTLTNLVFNRSDSEANAGLAMHNYGTIDSCAIRPDSNTANSYEDVKLTNSKADVAGFVYRNFGKISNSYVSGTIKCTASKGNASGFVDTNTGKITNCYSNSIVIATQPNCGAYGFVYTNSEIFVGTGSIEYSHVLGTVKAEKNKSSAYGFTGTIDSSKIKNCYTALLMLEGKTIYKFGQHNAFQNNNETNKYLENTIYTGTSNTTRPLGTEVTWSDLDVDAPSVITYKYNSDNDNVDTTTGIYPFPCASTEGTYLAMDAWGDWPKNTTLKLGMAYRETYSDNTTGIYGLVKERTGFNNYGETETINTLKEGSTTAPSISSADYGVLVPTGSANVKIGDTTLSAKTTTIEQNGQTYDYYIFSTQNTKHSAEITGTITCNYNSISLSTNWYYNDDFAAAISETKNVLGSADLPYQIRTATQLSKVNNGNATYVTGGKYYEQTYNVDLENVSMSPIGTQQAEFNGVYDGDAFTISNLKQNVESVTSTNVTSGGLFGYVTGTLKNIIMENANITIKTNSRVDYGYAGILAAQTKGGYVLNCQIIGNNTVTTGQNSQVACAYAGGLIGEMDGTVIEGCKLENVEIKSVHNIKADKDNFACYIGGMIGHSKGDGKVTNCRTTNKVTIQAEIGDDDGISALGGFIGGIDQSSNAGVEISQCSVAKTDITTTKQWVDYVGGFIGTQSTASSISNCYALCDSSKVEIEGDNPTKVGLFAGNRANDENAKIRYCHAMELDLIQADTAKLSEKPFIAAGGKTPTANSYCYAYGNSNTTINCITYISTTEQYKKSDTFTNWNFESIWEITNNLYPTLQSNEEPSATAAILSLEELPDQTEADASQAISPEDVSDGSEDAALAAETPAPDETLPPAPATTTAGLAYREVDSTGREGWYALMGDESGIHEDAVVDTLTIDQGVTVADGDATYGVLTETGTLPVVTGADVAAEPLTAVTIDGVDYDFYPITQAEVIHEDIAVTVTVGESQLTFTYNPDFAAAMTGAKPLGVVAEEGGIPYQIRTQAQLRNLNANPEIYSAKAYRQTLDIYMSDEAMDPIGGSLDFSGSYDAGPVWEGRTTTDGSANPEVDDSGEIPQGYGIYGWQQQVLYGSAEDEENAVIYGGLFARVTGALRGINLSGEQTLVNATASTHTIACVGTIAGWTSTDARIVNCDSDVTITAGALVREMRLGGLVGENTGTLEHSCYSGIMTGAISLDNQAGRYAMIGGLTGANNGGMILRSASMAEIDVTVADSVEQPLYGGVAGWSGGEDSSISQTWSRSLVRNAGGTIGGLVGSTLDGQFASILMNNYALVQLDAVQPDARVGLLVGVNGTPEIWYNYAACVDGDGNVLDGGYPLLHVDGDAEADVSNFLWTPRAGVDYDTLNAQGEWEMSNGYPTLVSNRERSLPEWKAGAGAAEVKQRSASSEDIAGDSGEVPVEVAEDAENAGDAGTAQGTSSGDVTGADAKDSEATDSDVHSGADQSAGGNSLYTNESTTTSILDVL